MRQRTAAGVPLGWQRGHTRLVCRPHNSAVPRRPNAPTVRVRKTEARCSLSYGASSCTATHSLLGVEHLLRLGDFEFLAGDLLVHFNLTLSSMLLALSPLLIEAPFYFAILVTSLQEPCPWYQEH